MNDRPSGVVTFLFTDVEGSVRVWEEDRGRAACLIDEHNRVIADAIAAFGGVVLSTAGEPFDASPSPNWAGVNHEPEATSIAFAGEPTYRTTHEVLPNQPRPRYTAEHRRDPIAAPPRRVSRRLATRGHVHPR